MANICRNCGNYLQDNDTFCDKCGASVNGMYIPQKKSHAGLIIGISAAIIVIVTAVILLFIKPGFAVKNDKKGSGGGSGVSSVSATNEQGRNNPDNTEVVIYQTTERTDEHVTESTERTSTAEEPTTSVPNTSSTTGTLDIDATEATDANTTETTTAAVTETTTATSTAQVGGVVTTASTTESKSEASTQAVTEGQSQNDNRPDFEKYGIRTDLPLNGNMDMIGRSTDGYNVELRGKVSVDSFTRKGVSEDVMSFGHENGIDFSGYEELRASFHAYFDDARMYTIGLTIMPCSYDYYNVKLYDDTGITYIDSYDTEYKRFTVRYNGSERYVYRWVVQNWTDHNDHMVFDCEVIYYVPAGYDGIVYGFKDPALGSGYIYENYDSAGYRLFRLK